MAAQSGITRRKGGRAAKLSALPAGDALVTRGTPNYTADPSSERICVIACGALAHEILDIVRLNELSHIALTCLPAILHNTPEKIVPEVEKAIAAARTAGFEHIYCGYADCGTGGALDRLLQHEGVERLPGAHCYAFFSGVSAFERREDDMTSFFLTDFLTRHFDNLTFRPLGLDRHPDLRDSYFGHYEKVVYLSQTDNPALAQQAQDIAERLSLGFEQRHTGYGDLADELVQMDHHINDSQSVEASKV